MILTKLHRPPVTKEHVYRDHLIRFLDKNRYKPFTLISAPAGYGKSMLISSWLEKCSYPYAWVSLSGDDNEVRSFLKCVHLSITKMHAGSLPDFGKLIDITELPPIKAISESLINDLDGISEEFILVLDDYHLIHNQLLNELVDLLLKYPPQNMHLVIPTRRDPMLNLSFLRAHSRMNEIRMNELCFSKNEIAILFKNLQDIVINDEVIDRLYDRTEGWITGLRLASLTLSNDDDPNLIFKDLSGDVHFIADFLIKEVILKQPANTQAFLLISSILNKFSIDILEHLMFEVEDDEKQISSGQEFIDWLLESNMFIIALDDKNLWFRYHHLFQDLLQNQLIQIYDLTQIKAFHLLASEWFEQNQFPDEAIMHALASGNIKSAANIVEHYGHDLIESEEIVALEHLLNQLPDDLIEQQPMLLIYEAWVARFKVNIPSIVELLGKAENLLNAQPLEGEMQKMAWCYLNSIRSFEKYAMLNHDQAKACSQNAIDLKTANCGYMSSFAYCVNSAAQQMSGEYQKALSVMESGLNDPLLQGTFMQGIMLHSLAKVCMMQADSLTQKAASKRLLNVIMEDGTSASHFWGNFDIGCSQYLLNDISGCIENLQSFEDFYDSAYPDVVSDVAALLSFSYQSVNLPAKASYILKILDDYSYKTENTRLQVISQAIIAELALRQGNLSSAHMWANSFEPRKLSAHYFFYLPEFTYAKILYSQRSEESSEKAIDVLSDLEDFSRATCNHLILIQVLALQSIILMKLDDTQAAMHKIGESVSFAEPSGAIRLLVDLSPELDIVLQKMLEQDLSVDYVNKILNESKKINLKDGDQPISVPQYPTFRNNLVQEKMEPLSFREIDVLKLLADGLRNKEIAEKLFISVETVKKHLKNVFSKLGVTSRIQAASSAKELGIVE